MKSPTNTARIQAKGSLMNRILDRNILLLVDDDPENIEIVNAILGDKYENRVAKNGVATPRTQKITWLLGGSGRVRARRLRLIVNSAGLRNRDRMTDG